MKHLIVSVSWQTDNWQEQPTSEDLKKSGHGYASSGNLPHERWNFNLHRHVVNGYKVGYFETLERVPRQFDNGKGVVFFCSKNYAGGGKSYIVGLYATAEVGDRQYKVSESDAEFVGNVRAPVEFCVYWSDLKCLQLDKARHFAGQTRMSQGGFISIDDKQAQDIIEDAMKANEAFQRSSRN